MSSALLSMRVLRKAVEGEGICSFELGAADGSALPPFSAGAHIDVHLGAGLVRQYSLCNAPQGAHTWRIAVLRETASRGGSAAMHERVREGELLQVSAPRNLFPLAEGAVSHLLLAGGIGITPLLSMAEHLASQGRSFELHYAARSPARMAFKAQIEAGALAAHSHFHFDDGAPAQRLNLPALLAAPVAGRHLYVCGPQGFIQAVLDGARAQGWAEDHLHCEYFGAAPAAAVGGDQAFEVQLGEGGRVVAVPAGVSVVKALADAGVAITTSCEQGVCGTCLTGVLAGECDHRDQYLTPEEQAANDQFLPCCSRARSTRLVLAL